nr:unnamed protein product [Callosobruchus analis]
MDVVYVRKLLECIFYGQGVTVVTIDKRPAKQMSTTIGQKGAASIKKGTRQRRSNSTRRWQMLCQVKLDDKDLEISKMRKTNQGDLLIEHKKRKTYGLQAIIESSFGYKTTKRVNESVVHIRGLDGVTTAGEVLQANATVILDTAAANKLESMKTLRIGLVHCQAKMREQDTRCNNCWEVGHETAACKGSNRANSRKNCGKSGQRQAECTADPFCPLCDQSGHRAWSFNCQRRKRPRRN